MDDTLDEIGERLTARSLVNSALDWWEKRTGGPESNATSKAKDACRSVARQVKEYPVPALLIGAGIAWIIVDAAAGDDEEDNLSGSARRRPYGTMSGGASGNRFSHTGPTGMLGNGEENQADESDPGLGAKAREMAGQVKDSVSGATGAAQDKMSDLGHAAIEQGRSAGQSISRGFQSGYRAGAERLEAAMEEYPLAVGIGFAALGALAGVLLPRTRREDDLLGEQSDQLLDSARKKGEEVLETGEKVAQRVGEAAMDEANNQGLTAQAGGDTVSRLADKAGEVIRRAKDEATTAAKEEGLTPEKMKA
jgi:ElaB/YqjD/DUF883 family membrane-anchored ribosome-binding protein